MRFMTWFIVAVELMVVAHADSRLPKDRNDDCSEARSDDWSMFEVFLPHQLRHR